MRSIVENESDHCFLCDASGNLEEHHIFGGVRNRKLSEQYGLKVHLCIPCHRGGQGVHFCREKMELLHRIGQQAFEKTHTRQEFVKVFGKNYLDPAPENGSGQQAGKVGQDGGRQQAGNGGQDGSRQQESAPGIIWLDPKDW